MRRKRADRPTAAPSGQETAAIAVAFSWDRPLLALVTCLLVATPLIPSESAVKDGTAAPLAALWLVAWALFGLSLVAFPGRQFLGGLTILAIGAFLGLHTLSALISGLAGNARQALNVLWLFMSYGTAAFLLRHLLHTKANCRALMAVMMGLAAVETSAGYYDYFVSGPERRAAFQKDPESTYRQLGAVTPTHRDQLRWRIESVEPTATFALTNSLAGFIAPWLIVLTGVALSQLSRDRWQRAALLAPFLAAMAACLLLTKSRTALLASGGGLVLLLLYGRVRGWRLGWKIPTLVGAGVVVLGLVAVAVGGLDAQVLTQAPQSVLYRLQYWRSTAGIIADYPLWGCGPGNFKEHYALYQLPEASETVSDPHNFLLEIWATAGTATLLGFLALAGAFIYELASTKHDANPAQPATSKAVEDSGSRRWIYGGAGGLSLGVSISAIASFPPEFMFVGGEPILPVIWVIGLPVAAAMVWLLDDWVTGGEMPNAVPVVALIVLLTNLLAAGAATFPGVFGSAWLLAPLALVHSGVSAIRWSISRSAALAGLAFALLLVAVCTLTEYSPVLRAGVDLEEGQRLAVAGNAVEADQKLISAAANDPWSPEPWRTLSDLRLQVWRQSKSASDWQRFVDAADQYRRRDSRHFQTYETLGNWYLAAWRTSEQPGELKTAVENYRQAAKWHPSRARQHAQLAWALRLAGQDSEAQSEAETALRLDRLNPHAEQKLAKQAIFDIKMDAGGAAFPLENAEQTMEQLRKGIGPEIKP